MDISSIDESAAAGLAQLATPSLAARTNGPDFGTLLASTAKAGDAASDPAATPEAGDSEEERLKAEEAARRQASLEYLGKWIASGGAPEELDRDRVITEEKLDKDGDGVPDVLQHAPENALETVGSTLADPEDQGKVHVVVTKIDAEGKPKITRTITMDNGDGQDRSELTPERAEAKNNGGATGESTRKEVGSAAKDAKEDA